jgi:heat shock protein HspQ
MSRFALGYRDPQQPDETFEQSRERSENCYRELVAENDEDESEYYPSAREVAEEALS